MPSVLYIHGFNSSPASHKARQLVSCMNHLGRKHELRVPELKNDASLAMAQLEDAIEALGHPLLVGSSLGGYYATVLAERHGLKAILINPAVMPWQYIDAYLGPQTNHYTGERWILTETHVRALAALEVPAPRDASRYQVWLQTGDETLDYRQAEAYYRDCTLCIEDGGDHGFTGFHTWLPRLLSFAGYEPSLWRDTDFSLFE